MWALISVLISVPNRATLLIQALTIKSRAPSLKSGLAPRTVKLAAKLTPSSTSKQSTGQCYRLLAPLTNIVIFLFRNTPSPASIALENLNFQKNSPFTSPNFIQHKLYGFNFKQYPVINKFFKSDKKVRNNWC